MAQSFTKIGETYFRKSDTGELYAVSDRDTLNALRVGSIPYNSVENTRGLTFAPTADVAGGSSPVKTTAPTQNSGGVDIAAMVKEKLASSLMSYKGVTNPADLEVRRQELLRKQLLSSPYSDKGEDTLTGAQKLTLLRNRGKELEPEIKSLEEQIIQRDKETESTKRDTSLTEINGHRVLVDNQTGEIIKDLGISKNETGDSGLSASVLAKVSTIAQSHDTNQLVKDYNVIQNKAGSMERILQSGVGGPGDLALVFEFMKALDPNSVVRETEYTTAAKSGNIFSGVFARFNGYLKEEGGFLPPNVQKAFVDIMKTKLDVATQQYENYHSEQARKINNITGGTDGEEYLTNYGAVNFTENKSKTVSKGTMSDKEFIEAALNANNVPYANAVSHAPKGQIPVIDNATGQIGSIPPGEFDKSKYTRL
jgi:hypothetical protein